MKERYDEIMKLRSFDDRYLAGRSVARKVEQAGGLSLPELTAVLNAHWTASDRIDAIQCAVFRGWIHMVPDHRKFGDHYLCPVQRVFINREN
jgi:hypothetical protein